MKVIFLDIDGVMNSQVFYEKRHKKRWLKPRHYLYLIRKFLGIKSKPVSLANYKTPDSHYTYEYQLSRLIEETCPEKWKWLSDFCNRTGTKICVSSVWRHHFGTKGKVIPEWWERALVHFGFNEGTFAGITGRGSGMRGKKYKNGWMKHKGLRIMQF